MTPEFMTTAPRLADQIRAIRFNDEQALGRFYRENFSAVEKYVMQNNGSSEEAKDIFQEAFVAVWRNIQMDRFQQQTAGSLEGYLFRIAKNKWLDHLRSSGYRNTVSLRDELEPTEESNSFHEVEDQQIRRLSKLVEQLGSNCREVLQRFYYKKDSLRTIAAAFQWTETTARNNKYRCLRQLKELFHHHG